jgi:hypothetical protein
MRIVYVAGPYRDPCHFQVHQNIARAIGAGAEIVRLGAIPLVPHANAHYYDGLQSDVFWLSGTLELMRRCDGVVVCDDWEGSVGTMGEVMEAVQRRMPIFLPPISWVTVRQWIAGDWDEMSADILVDRARRMLDIVALEACRSMDRAA